MQVLELPGPVIVEPSEPAILVRNEEDIHVRISIQIRRNDIARILGIGPENGVPPPELCENGSRIEQKGQSSQTSKTQVVQHEVNMGALSLMGT